MKAIVAAGIFALAVGACAATHEAGAVASPTSILAAPAQIRILSTEEVSAGMPVFADSGDPKTYVADFLTWLTAPGQVVERSSLFMTGEPPTLPAGVDFYELVEALAEEGHPAAQMVRDTGEPGGLQALADAGDPTARLALEMNNIGAGSLQQKVDALNWFREQAPTNKDAAFALGSFLLSQTSDGGDLFGMPGAAATPGEVREGAALLLQVADAASLDIMQQIGTMMSTHPGVDADVDGHARRILELVVASSDATPLPEPSFGAFPEEDEMDAYREYDAKLAALSAAVEARISLAGMLASGHGGPADIERAKGYYRQALDAMQDFRAYQALMQMGEDVSEYDAMFGPPLGDDLWDDPALHDQDYMPETIPEPAPAPPAN